MKITKIVACCMFALLGVALNASGAKAFNSGAPVPPAAWPSMTLQENIDTYPSYIRGTFSGSGNRTINAFCGYTMSPNVIVNAPLLDVVFLTDENTGSTARFEEIDGVAIVMTRSPSDPDGSLIETVSRGVVNAGDYHYGLADLSYGPAGVNRQLPPFVSPEDVDSNLQMAHKVCVKLVEAVSPRMKINRDAIAANLEKTQDLVMRRREFLQTK